MDIILCSEREEICLRWKSLLASGEYTFSQASSVDGIKQLIDKDNPQIILLHRLLVNNQSAKVLGEITKSNKVFLLSDRPSEDEGLAFLKLGVVGYANTYISESRLYEAVKVVLSGSVWLGQALVQRLILETVDGQEDIIRSERDKILGNLTKREQEIANFISIGKSNSEIAAELSITERTVKTHLSSIYSKTKTNSRLNLALLLNKGKSS